VGLCTVSFVNLFEGRENEANGETAVKLGIHYMQKNTSSHKGLIMCTSSNAGLYPFPMAPMYAVAKHGVVGAVRSLAPRLEKDGIRINALCPNCIGKFSSPSASSSKQILTRDH